MWTGGEQTWGVTTCAWQADDGMMTHPPLIRAAQAQRESGVNFSPGKSKSSSRWSLDSVARSSYNRNGQLTSLRWSAYAYWHPKAATQTSVEHPEKPLRKKFPNSAWILALKVAWIWRGFFSGREKRAEKIRGDFGTKFVTNFVTKFVTKFVPVADKIRDRIRAAKSKIHGELPPYFCVLSSRTERPPENPCST